jgi:hypothetical protein
MITAQKDVQDTLNASLAAAQSGAAECLHELQPNIEEVIIQLKATGNLIGIEGQMTNAPDGQVVMKYLPLAVRDLEHTLNLDRKSVNSTMGICSRFGVVAAKGQQILRVFDEIAAWHQSVSMKVPASSG